MKMASNAPDVEVEAACREYLAASDAGYSLAAGTLARCRAAEEALIEVVARKPLSALKDKLGQSPRHPSLEECRAAGVGPAYDPSEGYREGGMPNTEEERARFEAYMAGHAWHVGAYDEAKRCYVEMLTRLLYGVWRDRGSLPTVWPNAG